MSKFNDFDKYEKESYDVPDDMLNTDININPSFYIHTAILKAQQALLDEDFKSGFLKYRVFIEHIETICDANNMLPESYVKDIKEYRETLDSDEELNDSVKQTKIAHKKLYYIMGAITSIKQIETDLTQERETRNI